MIKHQQTIRPALKAIHYKKLLTFSLVLLLVACTTHNPTNSPSQRSKVPFDVSLGTDLLAFCDHNFGSRIGQKALTRGYVDLRTHVGCGPDCLRDFLSSGVDFVETEIAEGNAGRRQQAGSWEKSYKYFPQQSGKFRYYKAEIGDPACEEFETIADNRYRKRINLPKGSCIATEKVTSFTADYQVENTSTISEINFDGFKPIKYRTSSTIIRHRTSKEITAENSSANFSIAAAIKDPEINHAGDAKFTCLSDFPWSFLQNAFEPL